ncbi:MAG: CHRD domain-containing protein [bacterium]|nr:CHRD domain-containing protein [bacterium]
MRRSVRAMVTAGLVLAAASAGASEHVLRINSLLSLSVQNNAAICATANCLQREIRLPVTIDFAAGKIVIDARNPVNQNNVPVPPGGPGGILFSTQAGPAEVRFAEPCLNPDGCPRGIPIYEGTIDGDGNIRFPSLGMDFEVFGALPIIKFRAPMGTGRSIDLSDPNSIAEGVPLDFATGRVVLAGIQLTNAPVVGSVLQHNRITGFIEPPPTPPIAGRALLGCQKAIQQKGAVFLKAKEVALARCVDVLVACQLAAETGVPQAGCIERAKSSCDRELGRMDVYEATLAKNVARGCFLVGQPNLLAPVLGLNFGSNKAHCDSLGINTTTKEGTLACVQRLLACSTEQIVARLRPRASEVLAANGYGQFVHPNGCLPHPFVPGDAAGHDRTAVTACQRALDKEGAKYVVNKQKALQRCADAWVTCRALSETDGLDGVKLAACESKAQKACDGASAVIAKGEAARAAKTHKACDGLDAASIPALARGLGFENLGSLCAAIGRPLSSVDALVGCLGHSLDCTTEALIRKLEPRAAEVLATVQIDGLPGTTKFPCLLPTCGDGFVDAGEGCDALFRNDPLCNPDCTKIVCGDGKKEGTEECDDGNTANNDGCDSTCHLEPFVCGDGKIDPNEVCDGGNTSAGDGCSADCRSNETCGNGVVDTIRGEVCDDGGFDYVATLSGGAETPPVTTSATGSAILVLNPDNSLFYNVTTNALTGGTAAHIHQGAAGVAGPIVFTLNGGPTTWVGTTPPLSLAEVNLMKRGQYYVNVHTLTNPGGELRGQIGFAPPLGGDGCSADCRSNETCGNGVIDAVNGESCDDGGTTPGDGCDEQCRVEECSFAGSVTPLGGRTFSLTPATSGFFNSIIGPGTPVGTMSMPGGPMTLVAGTPDQDGVVPISLAADTIVEIKIPLNNQTQCFRFTTNSTGKLYCCGGHAVDMSNTRDSNTGGRPTSGGGADGPAVVLSGIGTGGPGDLLMSFNVRQTTGNINLNCLTATYPTASSTQIWTTGNATARVVRPAQGGSLFEFNATGVPFSCEEWTTEDGPGSFVNADTALNAAPGLDAGNVRKMTD